MEEILFTNESAASFFLFWKKQKRKGGALPKQKNFFERANFFGFGFCFFDDDDGAKISSSCFLMDIFCKLT